MSEIRAADDSKRRFTGRADVYSRYRPSYPEALIGLLGREAGLSGGSVIADVGSGTGKLTELFLLNGNTVFAVEPNDDMRSAAESNLSRHAGFRSVKGSAEATTLPDQSVDISVAGQAFHWFSPPEARVEFARITRSRTAAIVYNEREHADTGLSADYDALVRKYGRNFGTASGPVEGNLSEFFSEYRLFTIPNPKRLDLEALTGRILSASYMPGPGEPGHTEMLRDIERMFSAHQSAGKVTMNLTTEVYLGTV